MASSDGLKRGLEALRDVGVDEKKKDRREKVRRKNERLKAEARMLKGARKGDLRFWWIPQVPGTPFYKKVATVEQAVLLWTAFGDYDLFQYDEDIKPDYSNVGGLEIFEDGEWREWESEGGDDLGSEIRAGRWSRLTER